MFPDCYPELNETQRLVRDTIRKVVERELKPHVPAMESGEVLPYPYIKKLVAALGMGGQGELTEAMTAAAPEDKLEHFLPAAVASSPTRWDPPLRKTVSTRFCRPRSRSRSRASTAVCSSRGASASARSA